MSSSLRSTRHSEKHPLPDADAASDHVKKVKTLRDSRSIPAAANPDACVDNVKKDSSPKVEGNDLSSDGTLSNASHDKEVNTTVPTSRQAEHGTKQTEKQPIFSVGQSHTVVSMLPRVPEMSLSFGKDSPSSVIPFMLNNIMKGDEEKAEHMYNVAIHMEGHNMHSLFSADPRQFDVLSISAETHRVVNSRSKDEATFFTVGIVTSSSMTAGMWNQEVDVQPLARLWPRQHAVLTQLLQMNDLIIPTYKNGIQYSSARKPKSGGKEMKMKRLLMDGVTHGPPVHPWDVDIPLFQGVRPFRLTEYATLRPDFTELDQGDFVLVVFTVGGYRSWDRNMASLNIQFTIRLMKYDPVDCISREDNLPLYLTDETPICVDDITMMVIPEEADLNSVQANPDVSVPAGPLF